MPPFSGSRGNHTHSKGGAGLLCTRSAKEITMLQRIAKNESILPQLSSPEETILCNIVSNFIKWAALHWNLRHTSSDCPTKSKSLHAQVHENNNGEN